MNEKKNVYVPSFDYDSKIMVKHFSKYKWFSVLVYVITFFFGALGLTFLVLGAPGNSLDYLRPFGSGENTLLSWVYAVVTIVLLLSPFVTIPMGLGYIERSRKNLVDKEKPFLEKFFIENGLDPAKNYFFDRALLFIFETSAENANMRYFNFRKEGRVFVLDVNDSQKKSLPDFSENLVNTFDVEIFDGSVDRKHLSALIEDITVRVGLLRTKDLSSGNAYIVERCTKDVAEAYDNVRKILALDVNADLGAFENILRNVLKDLNAVTASEIKVLLDNLKTHNDSIVARSKKV